MALRPGRIGIWKCWFLWREENPRSKDENEQQTQPTYDTGTGNRTRATLVEGECSHHCAIPARMMFVVCFVLKESFLRSHRLPKVE